MMPKWLQATLTMPKNFNDAHEDVSANDTLAPAN